MFFHHRNGLWQKPKALWQNYNRKWIASLFARNDRLGGWQGRLREGSQGCRYLGNFT